MLIFYILCVSFCHSVPYVMCRIEKKRAIIPALLNTLQNHKSTDVNLNYFYQLLFTRENLKLVHIVCHKKGAHNLLCDTKKIFRTPSNAGKAKQKPKVKKRRLIWIFFMKNYVCIYFWAAKLTHLSLEVVQQEHMTSKVFYLQLQCMLSEPEPQKKQNLHINKLSNHEKHLFLVYVGTPT